MNVRSLEKLLILGTTLLALASCGSNTPTKFVAIKSNPEELDYAKYTCKAEAQAVGNRVSNAIDAATPDIKGGFAAGVSNGLQGTFEGMSARDDHYKACMARAGYRME